MRWVGVGREEHALRLMRSFSITGMFLARPCAVTSICAHVVSRTDAVWGLPDQTQWSCEAWGGCSGKCCLCPTQQHLGPSGHVLMSPPEERAPDTPRAQFQGRGAVPSVHTAPPPRPPVHAGLAFSKAHCLLWPGLLGEVHAGQPGPECAL